ncbi:MAG: hypothetical protein CSB34_06915 [Desulfobulbus propionicus]|nr:MAG: hypothetical protein CSB34_06915 [Desulfobulbus propionicus]
MQITDLIFLTTYAGPPVIGAFIGYLTNRIAIRMLFRPLHPWYIFGIRVPMTPGVIPSKRHALAENIGEMVGEHLLTSKEIGAALSNEPFQVHLHTLINDRVQGVLKKELGPVSSFIPQRFQVYFKVAVQTLKYRIGSGLGGFLASAAWQEAVYTFILGRLDELGEKKMNELIRPDSRTKLYQVLDTLIHSILSCPDTRQQVAGFVRAWIQTEAAKGKSLQALLPEQVTTLLHSAIEKQTPNLLAQLGHQLAEPFIREKIVQGMLGGIDHFIESMGPMGAMARGFIDLETLEKTIDQYLLDKEEDIVGWLQEKDIHAHLAGVLCNQVDLFLHRPLAELLREAGDEQLQAFCETLAEQLVYLLASDGQQPSIVASSIESWLEQGEATWDSITVSLSSNEHGGNIRERIAEEIVQIIEEAKLERLIHILTDTAIDVLLEKPVGNLHNVIPSGVQKGIIEYAVHTTNGMLLKEVPGLVSSLRISELVTEKVNSLDLLKLERLLLSIMEEQFKYINLFGALLGFLIGCINLFILRLV